MEDQPGSHVPGAAASGGTRAPAAGTAASRRVRTALVCLNLLALLLCAATLYWRWQSEVQTSERQTTNTAALLASSADALLDNVTLAVSGVADQVERSLASGDIDPGIVGPTVDKAIGRVPELLAIVLFDRHGRQVCGVPEERCHHLDVSDREYFARHRAAPTAPPSLDGPLQSRLDGETVLVVARALRAPDGAFGGLAIGLVPLQALRRLAGTASLGPAGTASLRRLPDLSLLVREPALPPGIDGAQTAAVATALRQAIAQSPRAGVVHAQSIVDGARRVAAYHRLEHHPVITIVGDAAQDYLAGWRVTAAWMAGFLLVFTAASVLFERAIANSQRQQERAQILYDQAPCGYHTLDAQGRYLSINATELSWLGCTRDELVGRLGPVDFFTAEGRASFAQHFPRLRAGQPVEGVEADLLGRDGVARRVAVSATPVFDAQGRFVCINSVMHDITPLKQAQDARVRAVELEAQNRALQESSRLKDEFLSNMSHELRTPLNAVVGLAYLLRSSVSGQDPAKRDRYLRLIEESAQHLLGLIQSTLDLAMVQASRMAFEAEPIDVRKALDEVADMAQPQRVAGGHLIEVQVEPGLDTVENDALRLRQMLLNLVVNAVKFSAPGTPVSLRARGVDAQHWAVDVEDRGIGIRPEDIGRLFQSFVQLDAGRTRSQGGTGLGLVLVRRIARAQGGDVTVRSSFGAGSVFTLTLPRQLPRARP